MADSLGQIIARMILALVIVLAIMISGMKIVQPNERGIYTRFGKFVGVLSPGLNLVTPLVSQVTRIDMSSKTYTHNARDMITNDRERVTLSLRIDMAVKDPVKVFAAVTSHKDIIISQADAELRTAVAGIRKDEVLSKLNSIGSQVRQRLKETGSA